MKIFFHILLFTLFPSIIFSQIDIDRLNVSPLIFGSDEEFSLFIKITNMNIDSIGLFIPIASQTKDPYHLGNQVDYVVSSRFLG